MCLMEVFVTYSVTVIPESCAAASRESLLQWIRKERFLPPAWSQE